MRRIVTFSLATQLVLVQLVLIIAVLMAVSAVSVEQNRATFQRVEGRRALALAESLAANPSTRINAVADAGSLLPAVVTGMQATTGVQLAMAVANDGTIAVSTDPRMDGLRLPWDDVMAAPGRSHSGLVPIEGHEYVAAAVPIMSNPDRDGLPVRQLGIAVAGQQNPSRLQSLVSAAPTLATYLGAALLVGVFGSLLLARWIKRQTLGMEPADMVALAEQREAIFSGIAEGVIALDTRDNVTFINPLARALLSLPADVVGRSLSELRVTGRLRDVLTAGSDSGAGAQDEVVIRAGKVLVLNRMPVHQQGRHIGSVTTLRDRTQLAELESELGAFRGTTDLLRAQAHEFANQLHTISGLIQIGEYDEVVGFVDTLTAKRNSLDLTVARRVRDSSVAALLVAKASLAAEKKVLLQVSERTGLAPLELDSAFDVATVLGNLIDNGIDAVTTLGPEDAWIKVEIRQSDSTVELRVCDSGPGIDASLATEVFKHGYTTKAAQGGERGIGLALARMICQRRGGEVVARNSEDGAVFIARMGVSMIGPAMPDDGAGT